MAHRVSWDKQHESMSVPIGRVLLIAILCECLWESLHGSHVAPLPPAKNMEGEKRTRRPRAASGKQRQTEVHEGSIVILGGRGSEDNCPSSGVFALDLVSRTWAKLPSMKACRSSSECVMLGDSLLVCGGFDFDVLFTVESLRFKHSFLYTKDEASSSRPPLGLLIPDKSWTDCPDMEETRTKFGVCSLNGLLWIVGGLDSEGEILRSVEVFDPKDRVWVRGAASMMYARQNHAVAVLNGRIYAMGGTLEDGMPTASVESYDPESNTWRLEAQMLRPREAFAAAVFEHCIFISGGYSYTPDMEDTVEAFDPSTFPPRWSSARRMSRARANHKLMALPDHGCILALGGQTRDGVDSSIERYDPQQEEWTEVTSSPRAGEQTSPAALRLPKALTNFACVRLDALQFDLENEQKSGETKILSDHRSRLDILSGNFSAANASRHDGAARAEWEIFAKAVDDHYGDKITKMIDECEVPVLPDELRELVDEDDAATRKELVINATEDLVGIALKGDKKLEEELDSELELELQKLRNSSLISKAKRSGGPRGRRGRGSFKKLQ